ncbi:PREDICTED: uncharacterized protein K02A2.6-like [Lupinus angustifolius]|uniref:uncharacterized protein K02A2.6-like n=1 Tax=Lupinus angustifolius TaxID=3871 RepID=UPI00092EA2AB|nr:PREDICTED: uncharacterized protein K02A2.6-like [Lupinus angustifolius]
MAIFHMGYGLPGTIPPAAGQLKFLIVAIDYFTKWIEAEPLSSITTTNIRKFTWRNIITQIEIPTTIVNDNGTQFSDQKFGELLSSLHIKQHFTSVEHPQTNGQVEAANTVLLQGNFFARSQWSIAGTVTSCPLGLLHNSSQHHRGITF